MENDYYLFANCNFIPGGYVGWQAAYDELAVHVWNKEPNTKAYYFGIPIEYAHDYNATTLMLAFEIYGQKSDLYETHFHSEAMGKFLTKIPPTQTTGLDLMHYGYVSGYLDKPGDCTECEIMQDTKVTAVSPEARKSLIEKLKTLGKSIEASGEKSIYTWMAFFSHDDDVGLRIYTRFATRADMEKYQARKDYLDFWFASKEEVKQMEWRCYLPNSTPQQKKGWLHR